MAAPKRPPRARDRRKTVEAPAMTALELVETDPEGIFHRNENTDTEGNDQ